MKLSNHFTNALWTGLAVALLAAGCATKSSTKKQQYTFFPPPPDEPRIQYLTSFGAESDLGHGSAFTDFVVGAEKLHRPIWKPYGVTVRKGFVYVCDTEASSVITVDLTKKKFTYLRPGGQDALGLPVNVVVDADGTRYVTDAKRGQVLVYGKDGDLKAEIGKMKSGKPCGIALLGDRLYVSDLSNHCVTVYSKTTRAPLLTVPSDAKDPKARLFSPTNVAVDDKGNIYVTDSGAFTTQVYDAAGKYVRSIGEQGLDTGRFALPKGVAVDRDQRVYVVDAATAVVQVFDKEGRLLMYFGEPKSSGPGGLYLPASIAIDYENVGLFEQYVAPGQKLEHLIFVTNQAGNQKVSIYGFLRKS